ncbi:MAG: FG-GAP-like repeat-containing protein [Rubrivivax sp.]
MRETPGIAVALKRVLITIMLPCVAACGGGGAGGGSSSAESVDGAAYFPLAVGDRWRYAEGADLTTVRVVGTQATAAGTAHVLRSESTTDMFEELYVKTTGGLTVVPSATDDAFIRALGNVELLRFPLVVGSSFVSLDKTIAGILDIDADGRADTVAVRIEVTVVGFETVSTPTGTFERALHARTVITQSFTLSSNGRSLSVTSTAEDWYARDIGPVRSVISTVSNGVSERVESTVQSFKVGAMRSERVAPSVVTRSPADLSTTRVAEIRATFSETMETSTLPTGGMTLQGPDGAAVPGHFVWDSDRELRFVADRALVSGLHTATIAAAVEDTAGNPMSSAAVWQFVLDASGPTLVASSPLRDAIEVPLGAAITLSFDEAPAPTTVTASNFWLEEFGNRVGVSVSVQGRDVTLTPSQPLRQGASYTVWISRFVTDMLGNQIGNDISFAFKADPGRFAAPVQVPALGVPTAVQLADLDADGRLDVVVAEGSASGSSRVLVLRRQADGSLASAADVLPTTAGCFPTGLAIADFDGDGLLDVASSSVFCGIQVTRQSSLGVWSNQGVMTQDGVYAIRSVPLAGQARPALVGTVGGKLRLWRPAAGGGFMPPEDLYGVGYALNAVEVGDIDNDGLVDIVASGGLEVGSGLVFARQSAGGGFVVQPMQIDNVSGLHIAIGDTNGDGRADVVFVRRWGNPALGILLQTPAGALAPARFVGTARLNPLAPRVVDIDGDGRQDIVLAHEGDSVVSLYRQTATGESGGEEFFEASSLGGYAGGTLAVGELSGDGRADILIGNQLLRQRVLPVPAAAKAATVKMRGGPHRGVRGLLSAR